MGYNNNDLIFYFFIDFVYRMSFFFGNIGIICFIFFMFIINICILKYIVFY